MNSIEDQVRAATRAEASTLREVRPLRLRPAAAAFRSPRRWRGRGWRGRRGWLAPVTAAAVVVALAIALVIIKDVPNGSAVPAVGWATAPGGVPQYYVTLYNPPAATPPVPCAAGAVDCATDPPTELLIGDTLTGARVTMVSPPAGSTFYGVTGAADDRTFVVDTVGTGSGGCKPRTFYRLTIAPGTATPSRLTKLGIPPLGCVDAIALSGSGSELAVAYGTDGGRVAELQVYSVATGRLAHGWSSDSPTLFNQGSNPIDDQNSGLSWMDDDRALAFPAVWPQRPGDTERHEALRMVDLTAAGRDLIKDSRIILSETSPVAELHPPGCDWDQGPLVTEEGNTIVCISVQAPISLRVGADPPAPKRIVPWRLSWLAYSTATPQAAPRVLYQATVDAPVNSSFRLGELWTNASGSTVIGYRSGSFGRAIKPAFFGLIGRGALRPLPTPPAMIPAAPAAIAW